jgi:hypothetical protein
VLARQGGYQQVKRRERAAHGSQLMKQLSELHRCLLIRWPEAKNRHRALQSRQVPFESASEPYPGTIFTEHWQANAKAIATF